MRLLSALSLRLVDNFSFQILGAQRVIKIFYGALLVKLNLITNSAFCDDLVNALNDDEMMGWVLQIGMWISKHEFNDIMHSA